MKIPIWVVVIICLFALVLIYLFLKFIVPIAIIVGIVLLGISAYNKYLKESK